MPQRDALENEIIDLGYNAEDIDKALARFDDLVDDGLDPNDAYGIVIADYE